METTTKNVMAFEKLLGCCTKSGASYKPTNPSIESTALTAVLEEAQKSVIAVQDAKRDLAKAVALREQAYDALPTLGVRIVNAAAVCGMNQAHLETLDKMRKRFRSQPFLRKGTALTTSPGEQAGQPTNGATAASAEAPVRKHRTLSYDAKLQTLSDIINFLSDEASYHPNESDLSIAELQATLDALHAHTATVNTAKTVLNHALDYRNAVIFSKTGLCGTAKVVKQYFRSLLGADHKAYQEIDHIKFTKA